MNGRDLIDAIGVRTAEDEAVVYIAVHGADEGHGDAVGGRRVAGLEAVEAALRRDAVLGEGFDEGGKSARPGMWTGLCTMVTSLSLAFTYIFLNSSAASHSLMATKRVAICAPERPRER